MELLQYKTMHFRTAQIDTEIGNVYVISAYFQHSHDIGTNRDYLGTLLRGISGKHILIRLDYMLMSSQNSGLALSQTAGEMSYNSLLKPMA